MTDPRLCQPEHPTADDTAADLDELERTRFFHIARRMERMYRNAPDFKPELIPTIWAHAHDRAIYEVAQARRHNNVNGNCEWHDKSWRT